MRCKKEKQKLRKEASRQQTMPKRSHTTKKHGKLHPKGDGKGAKKGSTKTSSINVVEDANDTAGAATTGRCAEANRSTSPNNPKQKNAPGCRHIREPGMFFALGESLAKAAHVVPAHVSNNAVASVQPNKNLRPRGGAKASAPEWESGGQRGRKKHGALFGGRGEESFICGSLPGSSCERRERRETERRETERRERERERERRERDERDEKEMREMREMRERERDSETVRQ